MKKDLNLDFKKAEKANNSVESLLNPKCKEKSIYNANYQNWVNGELVRISLVLPKELDIQVKNFMNRANIKHKNTAIIELLKYALGLTE